MTNWNPMLLIDSYKVNHADMYPQNMTKLYSNLTPRKSRLKGIDNVVVFGIQHFCLEYLIKSFNEEFFGGDKERIKDPRFKDKIVKEYSRHIPIDTKRIEALWDLGYLPIEIKALPEGTLCPIGVPVLTITNTHPDFAWLVNYLETLLSCMLWQPITSATIAYEYKKLLNKYALETTGSTEGVQWQAHDFSMRGMSSPESAILSSMGHLLSFTGTDTIPAIYQLEKSYNAKGLIGASVPATEHSVMCMGTKESEIDTFKRLLKTYPTGILSVVSDTWDLWKVCTEYLPDPELMKMILAREGKLVIRPDSGDPVDIICGNIEFEEGDSFANVLFNDKLHPRSVEQIGVIELLWNVFGGTINEKGYKVLDPHIGAIYGDSITLERAEQICERLKAKGFASTNIVFGVGSYTYQYNTRDTFGFAMKATYGELRAPFLTGDPEKGHIIDQNNYYVEPREIFKDPITDDGTKRSKKGLLQVVEVENMSTKRKHISVIDQCTWKDESNSLLQTVFKDSELVRETSLEEIRNKLK